jgi:hypothetical protein
MKTLYKLYQEDKCFGDQSKRDLIKNNKIFICENKNMNCITDYITLNGDKTKTYTIFKYIDDDLRWRQLSNKKYDTFHKGDLTTVWLKMCYNKLLLSWKETNFRYNDEIIYKSDTCENTSPTIPSLSYDDYKQIQTDLKPTPTAVKQPKKCAKK